MVPVSEKDVPELATAWRDLARDRGVSLKYVDGMQVRRRADPQVLAAVLNAFGDMEEVRSASDARTRLRERRAQRVDAMVEPVYVVDEGVENTVPIRLGRRRGELTCRLEFEFGSEISWGVSADSLTVMTSSAKDSDGPTVGLVLPALRVGYHDLHLTLGRRTFTTSVIVRPLHGARGRFARDWRAFSVQAPMFSLHSKRTWGAGDVGDLDEFARLVSVHHASVVSTLPLLASFGPGDFERSPYRPVSRMFWSDRWIALDRVPDLARSPVAQRLISETFSPERRAKWVLDGEVDGARAFEAKRHVLQSWIATRSDIMADADHAVATFVMARPDVNDYARFRAAGEQFGLDWRRWPSTARSGLLRWNDVDPSLVRYHVFAQWIIDEQMRAMSSNMAQRGQTLELDIPVGVHPYGYDVWSHRDQYVTSMSIGAPPDALAERGQDWGSPPPHPDRGRDDAHRQFRAALAFHMRVAGVVRIDHVMGLQRLFWVPQGGSPEQGLYVRMPLDELLAVVAIEAQRSGVDVVGEDLGTVEEELRDAMTREGLRRTYVAQYAIDVEEGALDEVPNGSVASFATHDTATFAGWWGETDIDERVALELIDEGTARLARATRADERRALVRSLGCDVDEKSPEVIAILHERLAGSDAGLVMVQLDDLLGETRAVNLPGTSTQRPNWSRRSRLSLEEMATSRPFAKALAPLSRLRGFATSPGRPRATTRKSRDVTRFSANDLHLLSEGRHFRLHEHLGCHPMVVDGVSGCYFALWAPNAERVSVIGDFNKWDPGANVLIARESSGVWEGFVAGANELDAYKYRLRSRLGGVEFDKADPMGRLFEVPPATATRVWRSTHDWGDGGWMAGRVGFKALEQPLSIYEVHLGSWRRVPEEGNRSLTYREVAPLLCEYALEMGFTHVELMPVMEHPFYGSWGYQTTGYFAPTSRMGSPDDFKFLVDCLHQAGVGVILDWVPSHFPADEFALANFDGTHLYEHADVRQRVHPDWQSWTFNYGRNEVRSFLTSNACFWLDEYHADGLRLDAVASMLYLDYSRKPGEWSPNRLGGHEDLEAVDFLRQCTTEVTTAFPDVVLVAEESTAWPAVTGAVAEGGLGFTLKWDLGWMHDTLDYLERDPVHRRYHQNDLTFRAVYAANENFVLPLSHDEVVHGKGSLLAKMAGDGWQRRANLRLLFGYQYALPGKKMLFMGDEFGQDAEWDHEASLDWHLLDDADHLGVQRWVQCLNALYREHPALHRDEGGGEFAWISCDDTDQSVLIWRRGFGEGELVVLANFTPIPRAGYGVRGTAPGTWSVLANSDDLVYGGSGHLSHSAFSTTEDPVAGGVLLTVDLPPLALVVLGRLA